MEDLMSWKWKNKVKTEWPVVTSYTDDPPNPSYLLSLLMDILRKKNISFEEFNELITQSKSYKCRSPKGKDAFRMYFLRLIGGVYMMYYTQFEKIMTKILNEPIPDIPELQAVKESHRKWEEENEEKKQRRHFKWIVEDRLSRGMIDDLEFDLSMDIEDIIIKYKSLFPKKPLEKEWLGYVDGYIQDAKRPKYCYRT
jgi:hypothetical protein